MSRYSEMREMRRIKDEADREEAAYLAWLKTDEGRDCDSIARIESERADDYDPESHEQTVRDDMMGRT